MATAKKPEKRPTARQELADIKAKLAKDAADNEVKEALRWGVFLGLVFGLLTGFLLFFVGPLAPKSECPSPRPDYCDTYLSKGTEVGDDLYLVCRRHLRGEMK